MAENQIPVDLKLLINTIKTDKCILLLGPDLITTEAGENYHAAMVNSLKVNDNENILNYYSEDEFFLFKQTDDTDGKMLMYYDILDFYTNNKRSETLLREIAKLPVSLVISITPDQTLYDVYQRNGINTQFAYYDKNKPSATEIKIPTKNNPLIYNLLGHIDDMESLVFTHQDLFDFLEGALNRSRLPDNLRDVITSAHSFIFLGFKFEKWYLQLLLRLLKLPKNKIAANFQVTKDAKTFFSEQFNLKFTDLKPYEFIDMLLKECENAKIPLRQLTDAISDEVLKIKLLIERNKMDEALEAAKKQYPDKSDNFTMLLSRHTALTAQINNNTIDTRDANVEMNKIKYALLNEL